MNGETVKKRRKHDGGSFTFWASRCSIVCIIRYCFYFFPIILFLNDWSCCLCFCCCWSCDCGCYCFCSHCYDYRDDDGYDCDCGDGRCEGFSRRVFGLPTARATSVCAISKKISASSEFPMCWGERVQGVYLVGKWLCASVCAQRVGLFVCWLLCMRVRVWVNERVCACVYKSRETLVGQMRKIATKIELKKKRPVLDFDAEGAWRA